MNDGAHWQGFQRTWSSEPFVVHGPTDRLRSVFHDPALQSAATALAAVKSRPDIRVRAWFKTSKGDQSEVTLTAGEAAKLFDSGVVTLVIDGVERVLPAVRELMESIQTALSLPEGVFSCNLYVSPAGVGTAAHFDQQDNVLVQIGGSKAWQLARNLCISNPSTGHVAGAFPSESMRTYAEPFGRVVDFSDGEIVLNPGSVLHIPRGFWHQSQTPASHSLALTLTFPVISRAEYVMRVLRRELLGSAEWRRREMDGACVRSAPEEFKEYCRRTIAQLSSMLTTGDRIVEGLADEILGRRLYRRGRHRQWMLTDTDEIVLIAHSRRPERIRVPPLLAPVVRGIAVAEDSFRLEDIVPRDLNLRAADLRSFGDKLLQLGVLDPATHITAEANSGRRTQRDRRGWLAPTGALRSAHAGED